MSRFVRYPLTLLAVLAAMLFLPGLAWAGTSTTEQCASAQPPAGCDPAPTGGTTGDTGAGGGTPAGQQATDPPKDTGTPGQQQGVHTPPKPAGSLIVVPFQASTAPQGPVVSLAEVPPVSGLADPGLANPGLADPGPTLDDPLPPAPNLCDQFPTAPICTGTNPPTIPLTCDGLAQLLGRTGGCPSSFTCADLAGLLGITCPASPPDCATLAALFHLAGCPQPPTSCQEFADLLGVGRCAQIPCLDTFQLPASAREGLQPLFDGLKQIGVRQCPFPEAPRTPGRGTQMPRAQSATDNQQQPPAAEQPAAAAAPPATTPTERTTAQPKGKLAYTGLDLGPQLNVAWTLLVLGAGLLILGRRRA